MNNEDRKPFHQTNLAGFLGIVALLVVALVLWLLPTAPSKGASVPTKSIQVAQIVPNIAGCGPVYCKPGGHPIDPTKPLTKGQKNFILCSAAAGTGALRGGGGWGALIGGGSCVLGVLLA